MYQVSGMCHMYRSLRMTLCLMIAALTALVLLVAIACEEETAAVETTVSNEVTSVEETSTADSTETSSFDLDAPGYITFAINVHDTVHVDESADTILRLIDIYEKYGVRGDFYFTAPIVQAYSDKRPDVIERLKDSDMTISYHVRPPHALHSGFDQRLRGMDSATLAATLLDYETFALDPATGDLLRDQPGGYSYVADMFGRNPVCAPSPNKDPQVKAVSQQLYASLGAQMTLLYHEEGTAPDEPFVWVNELLVRPSDFSITRWNAPGDKIAPKGEEPFWWNMLTTPQAEDFDPTAHLQERLSGWNTEEAGRPPIITSLIHENNFSRSGPEGWNAFYFSGGEKSHPLSPPFNLNAPESSTLRPVAEQETIWTAYEEMVAWASANLRVVTSEDIVEMAVD